MIDKTWQIVLWGFQKNNHTHHWIHAAYYKAFQYLGYNTQWFDDDSKELPNLESKTLFITEHQVDEKIPVSKDNFYVLHNVGGEEKYRDIPKLVTQTYTVDTLKYGYEKIDDCIYFSKEHNALNYIWATDLLPHEIIKPEELRVLQGKTVNWVGSAGGAGTVFGNEEELEPFRGACREHGIEFKQQGLWAAGSGYPVSNEDNVRLIKESYMAPTIVGAWQRDKCYVPCRIFKNISYGQPGLTNSKVVWDLFQRRIVYNPDTYQLFRDAKKSINEMSLEDLHWQMDFVAQKHTYINRINLLLGCANKILGEK